jgi:DNA-directed RNA polymerase specialized sigma24 family protein
LRDERLRGDPSRAGWSRQAKPASVAAAVHAPEDDALLARALDGDRAAMRELASRLIAPIQREVAVVLGRATQGKGVDARQEVLDLVQDVLVLLFEHDARELRRWDPSRGRGLHSYVRLVARRRVSRVLSQRRGNPYALVLVADAVDSEASGDEGKGRCRSSSTAASWGSCYSRSTPAWTIAITSSSIYCSSRSAIPAKWRSCWV